MGLFSLFKSKSRIKAFEEPVPPQKLQTIYFQNGIMSKIMYGSQDDWYDARYMVSDGIMYDLESIEDIRRIPIPTFGENDYMSGYGVTGSLDYVIRMKAGRLREKGMIAESDECYRKANDLMRSSGIGYDMTPYLYLAKNLLREGRFEESEAEEKRVYAMFGTTLEAVCSNKEVRPYITQEDREYYRLKYLVPDKAPKSISGYSLMKKKKSANFLKLLDVAERHGIQIVFDDRTK